MFRAYAFYSLEFGRDMPEYEHMSTQGAHLPLLTSTPQGAYQIAMRVVYKSSMNGREPGDPTKAATVMYELAIMDDPPLRVIVGSDAYQKILQKIEVRDSASFQM